MFDTRRARLPRAMLIAAVTALVLLAVAISGCIGPRGWPGVASDGSVFYAGTLTGTVVALNPEGGRIWKWEPRIEQTDGGFFSCACRGGGGQFRAGMFYAPPTIGNGTVYVAGYNGVVYAIDGRTSDDLWKYDTGSPIVGGIAIDNGTLFVGTSDGLLYALNANATAAEGTLRDGFEPFQAGDKIWSTPTVSDGVVYFGSLDHNLYALDAGTGKPVWNGPFRTGGAITSPALVVNSVVYIGSFDAKLYAVDAATGTQKWVFEEATNSFWSKPVYDQGVLYACSLDHKVYAVDAESGNLTSAWPGPFDVGSPVNASPVIVNDTLVVASDNGLVYGIALDTGKERWAHIDLKVKVFAPLCASAGKVYLNGQDNRLYRIDVASGRQDLSISLSD